MRVVEVIAFSKNSSFPIGLHQSTGYSSGFHFLQIYRALQKELNIRGFYCKANSFTLKVTRVQEDYKEKNGKKQEK